MKTIHNSDIRFELNPRIIYVEDFEMTFYTVNKRDFSFRKTSADVQEVEVSGETKYYLDLDWSLLSYVGKGVLNYQCINNIADPSFPDGEYNQLVEKATDYYIDTFKVEPESADKSITELLGEEVEARIAGDAALSGAVDTEVDARIAADEAISGAVDTALSGKQDTLIAGDNITISGNVISASGGGGDLSNYYTKNEVDSALSGKADSDDVYTKSETSGKTEISTALDGKLDVTAYTPTDLSNYYTKSETSGSTELATEFATKLDTTAYTPTDLSNYYTKGETSGKTEISTALSAKANSSDVYTKGETSGKTELNTAFASKLDVTAYTPTDLSNYYTKSETSGKTEISTALSAKANSSDVYSKSETSGKTEIASAITDEATARANADTALSGAVDTALLGYVNDAAYVSTAKTINLLHGSTVIASIDATDFIKDGMVDNVVISGGSLVITFNTDSGKEAITIALTDIFDPSNYYTKTDVDGIVSGKADTTAVTEAISEAVSGKADSSDVYLKSETSGKTEIATALSAKLDTTAYTPTDLSNYYTKSETSGKTEISTALSAKANSSDVYTKSETSGKTEISTALATKLDTTAYTPTDLSNYYTKSETSGKTEISTALSAKLDTTAYTPTDLSNYYTKSETSGATELDTAFAAKQGTLSAGTGIDITSNVISVTGGTGGKAVSGGTNISITTGETADTINCTLPISGSIEGIYTTSSYPFSSTAIKRYNAVFGNNNLIDVFGSSSSSNSNAIFGQNNKIKSKGSANFIAGSDNVVNAYGGHNSEISDSALFGKGNKVLNIREFAIGSFNVSNNTTDRFPLSSGNTLFSVGNGTADNARHNAFEIRQNGDIYITSGGTDIKLQDNLGGGGSSVTVVQTTGTSSGDVMSQNAVTTALATKLDTTAYTPTDLSNYYTKSETSGKTEISTALAAKQGTLSAGTGIDITNDVISVTGGGGSSITVVQTTGTSSSDVMSQNAVTTALSGKQETLISGTNIKSINGNSILGSGNIDIEGGNNVVELTQAQYNAIVTSGTVDPDVFYIITDATPADLTNYYTKSETSGATEISTALSAKLDTTAYTPTDLTNYYTKSETSGKSEISTALAAKQDTLSAGTGIDITSNVISVTGGGGSITIDPSLDSGSTNAVANSAITTAINAVSGAVPTQYVKKIAQNSDGGVVRFYDVWKESGYAFPIYNFSINGKMVLSKQNGTYPDVYNFKLVETSAITTSVTSSSTDSQVPSAKAVYDAIQEGGGGSVTIDPTLDSGSTNPVANSAITTAINAVSGAVPTTYVSSIGNDTDAGYSRFFRFSTPSNFNYFILRNAKINGRQVLNSGWSTEINEYNLVETSAITSAITSGSTDAQVPSAKAVNDKLGGLSIVQITQAQYDALTTKDASTLYVIVS